MLSIAKLTPGQEGYYERSVAAGLDEYYEGHGESPGVWTGRGASELELEGVVQEGELGRLIRGIHPHTEKQLRTHPEGAADHDRADRPADRRAPARDEEARAGGRVRPRVLAAQERQPPPRAWRRGDPPRSQRGASIGVAGGAWLPRRRGVRDPSRPQRRPARARWWVRRGRLSAPHEPGPGPAPPHARDRRQHGEDPERRRAGVRSTASRSSRATGSPPVTSTRLSSVPS